MVQFSPRMQGIMTKLMFFIVEFILMMCLISMAIVGRSLMFDNYTTLPSSLIRASPQSGQYFATQRSVLAFDFFYMVGSWVVLYSTFKLDRMKNIICNVVYFLIWIGRWASAVAFLNAYPVLAQQLYNGRTTCMQAKAVNCNQLTECERVYAWYAAYQEQIAAAVLFFIFGLAYIPLSYFVHANSIREQVQNVQAKEMDSVDRPVIVQEERTSRRYSGADSIVRETIVQETLVVEE